MYDDGSIVPFFNFRGVKFSEQQINDYVEGKVIRIDGCSGSHSTEFIKFSPERKVSEIYSSNPDAPNLTSTSSFAPSFSHAEQSPTLDDVTCSVSCGDAESFPEFKERHQDLTPKHALDAWRDKRRSKHLNGCFHM